jgi:SAM-dependent methyltransferase
MFGAPPSHAVGSLVAVMDCEVEEPPTVVPRLLTVGTKFKGSLRNPGALSGNRAESVLENAALESVGSRVEVKHGDVRTLPFTDGTFDAVVSNFVVHELKTRSEREQMMREIARVLKPGGRVALVDFIFTDDCVRDLRRFGVIARRERDGFLSFWISAVLNFGLVKTYHVTGQKTSGELLPSLEINPN